MRRNGTQKPLNTYMRIEKAASRFVKRPLTQVIVIDDDVLPCEGAVSQPPIEAQGETASLAFAFHLQREEERRDMRGCGEAASEALALRLHMDEVKKAECSEIRNSVVDEQAAGPLLRQLHSEHIARDVVLLQRIARPCLRRHDKDDGKKRQQMNRQRLSRLSVAVGRALAREKSVPNPLISALSTCGELSVLANGQVLRLVSPQGKASPCVLVRDPFGDHGRALALMLERFAHGGIKRLKRQATAHVRGHPKTRRRINCPSAPIEMLQLADKARKCAACLVEDAALSPSDTDEQRRLAAKEFLKRGQQVPPYGLMYHPAYPGLCKHVDKGGGRYMVLFNLGLTCIFHCGTTRARKFEFEFRSGDAVIFNDGNSHGALHGMPRIRPGTAPEILPPWLSNVRIGLQFRERKAKRH